MGIMSLDQTTPDTVVLIHGLWMTPRSWERWVDRYQARGFHVLAPAWPGLEGEVEALRDDPTPIAGLTAQRIIDHYDRVVRALPRPPIIMGHSFGGAFTQVLLDRGLGAAGVAIDSAPVKGVVRVTPAALRSAFPVLRSPANRHRAVPLTRDQFHYSFTNTMGRAQSDRVYDRYHVPAAGHVLFEGALATFNRRAAIRVDFGRDHRAPLLFIAGGADHLIPTGTVKANTRLYWKSLALTAYHEFPGRAHFILGQDGWEEVADHALNWAVDAARSPAPAPADRAPGR